MNSVRAGKSGVPSMIVHWRIAAGNVVQQGAAPGYFAAHDPAGVSGLRRAAISVF